MRGWRRFRRSRVIVNLKTGKAFEGLLWDSPARVMVLRHAELLENGARTKVDGDIVFELVNVDFVQVLPAPTASVAFRQVGP